MYCFLIFLFKTFIIYLTKKKKKNSLLSWKLSNTKADHIQNKTWMEKQIQGDYYFSINYISKSNVKLVKFIFNGHFHNLCFTSYNTNSSHSEQSCKFTPLNHISNIIYRCS